jgi:putative DNA primase/helicase
VLNVAASCQLARFLQTRLIRTHDKLAACRYGAFLMPETTPGPEIPPKPPVRPPLPVHPVCETDPRIAETPPPEDFGIPGIRPDKYGRFQVPKLKADYCLLEVARTEFYVGMNLDEPKSIDWLWPERIPIGKLTLIEGESGSGTSFLVADLAARVSAGSPWPGLFPSPLDSLPPAALFASGKSGHVMFVLGGDNMHDTLTPRLIGMGANLYDFTILSGITTHDPAEMRAGKAETHRRLSLPADLGHLEYQLRKRPDTRLLVVDSLSDFCQTDKQFRDTLAGLQEIAERCNVALVATARPRNWHSARGKLKPSADRRSESVRCLLNVLVDPHDPSQRYLAPARMNFCREPKWVPFRIGEGKVDWGESLEAAPVYARLSEAAQEKVTLLMEAKDCLEKTLATGDLPAKTALRLVMECGFSKATVVRARLALGVRSYRERFGLQGWWNWSIRKEAKGASTGAGKNGAAENGASGKGNEEAGDEMGAVIVKEKPIGSGPSRKRQPLPSDEFGGDNFDRLSRAEIIQTLNQERAVEIAVMGQELAGGALPHGKKGKNGKRKPR